MNQFDFEESGEKLLSVSCYEEEINAFDNLSNKIQTKSRLAIMKIGGKNVKILIDLGAYASLDVLLIQYLPKRVVVEKSVIPSRCTQSQPMKMKTYLIDFTIVDSSFTPLLGLETAQKMKLLVVQTQNILSIREDAFSCDAQKLKFPRDAMMSEH